MKLVIRTMLFHIICILMFATCYYILSDSFVDKSETNENKTFLDYFLLSVTIQSGVGYSFLDPINYYSKIFVILQQLIMMSTHIITLYVFTM